MARLDRNHLESPGFVKMRDGSACDGLTGEVDPKVWLRPFRLRVESLLGAGGTGGCADLRTASEWKVARALGATLWLVDRPGAGAPGGMVAHATEREAAGADRSRFDAVILNDDTLEALHLRVEQALTRTD